MLTHRDNFLLYCITHKQKEESLCDVAGNKQVKYHIFRPIRHTVIFSLDFLENNDECILILVIYWKKTGLLHTKISNHNIIYSS